MDYKCKFCGVELEEVWRGRPLKYCKPCRKIETKNIDRRSYYRKQNMLKYLYVYKLRLD